MFRVRAVRDSRSSDVHVHVGSYHAGKASLLQYQRSYVILQARLLRQKTENRYLAVLVAARGVNRCRKALFGASSRPDTPTALLGGETVEH